jgi:perosamine synthetase
LSTVVLDPETYGRDARATMNLLQQAGVQTRPIWEPMHSSAVFTDCFSTDCSVSERLYREALSLPSSVTLDQGQLEKIIRLLGER